MLLLGGDDACTHLLIRFCFRHSLNSAQRKEHCMLPARCRLHRESLPTHALNTLVNALRVVSPGIQLFPGWGYSARR
ncbi:hypothetical protein D9N32_08495 [Escherichia coli]|nr:hypothetical protein D9N32_08495 [Escherichia coli]HAJ2834651.1 hypothetical protein [Escherichia coli]HAJ5706557.1 hypothetical protein [Escherichia coli]